MLAGAGQQFIEPPIESLEMGGAHGWVTNMLIALLLDTVGTIGRKNCLMRER